MRFLLKILLTALFIMVLAHYFNMMYVRDTATAVVIALVLAVLNAIVRPVLVILTLPVTIFTLGLFLMVINASMILLATEIVGPAFRVGGWMSALWISLLLSVYQYLIESLVSRKK